MFLKMNDVYGTLSAEETLCYALLKDEVDKFLVSIDNPFEQNKKIDVSVVALSSSKLDIDVKNDKPKINVKLNLRGKVISEPDNLSLSYDETLDKLNAIFKDSLSKKITNYLYKTSKEYDSDINEFYRTAKRKFKTTSDFDNYNWAQKYKDAEFNVELNDNMISSLLIKTN